MAQVLSSFSMVALVAGELDGEGLAGLVESVALTKTETCLLVCPAAKFKVRSSGVVVVSVVASVWVA